MKKLCLIAWIIMTVLMSIEGQEQKDQRFATYQEMRAHAMKLYQQKDYAEAAEILEKALTQFPDHLHANTFNLALMHVLLKDPDKALKTLENALDQGVFYG